MIIFRHKGTSSTKFKRILIICLAGIGDTLLFTPSIRILRQEFPFAWIDVLVMYEGSKNILENSPHLNRVVHWNFMQQGMNRSIVFCLKLRQNNYDVSLTSYPSNRYEYNMVSFLAGAKLRIGHQYNVKCSYGTDRLAFHHCVPESKKNNLHNVEENLKLLECLSINPKKYAPHRLCLYLSQQDKVFAEEFLRTYRDTKSPLLIGIHPGSGETKNLHLKRWPISHFAQLADSLIEKKMAQIFVFGGDNEKHLRCELAQLMTQKPILVEKTSFRQTAALIQHCDVFISADTGLMHTAAAVETPTIALFGPTNPNLTFPWTKHHQIVTKNLACSPCYFYSNMKLSCLTSRDFECIQSISVADVMNQIDTFIIDLKNSKVL